MTVRIKHDCSIEVSSGAGGRAVEIPADGQQHEAFGLWLQVISEGLMVAGVDGRAPAFTIEDERDCGPLLAVQTDDA